MRTIGEIIEAVDECQPATEEELRLTVKSLCGALMLASCHREDCREERIKARWYLFRAEPDKWLGPRHTPGTPENKQERELAMRIARKAGVL